MGTYVNYHNIKNICKWPNVSLWSGDRIRIKEYNNDEILNFIKKTKGKISIKNGVA